MSVPSLETPMSGLAANVSAVARLPAWALDVGPLCGLGSLSLRLRGRDRDGLLHWLCDKPLAPWVLGALGVLHSAQGYDPAIGAPSVPNRAWREHVPEGPRRVILWRVSSRAASLEWWCPSGLFAPNPSAIRGLAEARDLNRPHSPAMTEKKAAAQSWSGGQATAGSRCLLQLVGTGLMITVLHRSDFGNRKRP
jgi:hypothetical protein